MCPLVVIKKARTCIMSPLITLQQQYVDVIHNLEISFELTFDLN